MSSPSYDPAFASRIRTANASVGDRPDMAVTLASSDLSEGDISMVGGFSHALDTSQLVSLSRLSGARPNLSAEDRGGLDALGVDYDDVVEAPPNDERNWLERVFDKGAEWLANTGEFLGDIPGVGDALHFMMWLNQAAKLPVRLLSSAIDQENDDEIDAGMRAKGYDPSNPGDYLLFMLNQGNSLYHDLDRLREVHGDKAVDLAIAQQVDPAKFAETLADRSEEDQALAMSEEFANIADLVDRQHISPGRDVARLFTFGNTDSKAFTAISATVDGAYTLMLDPTLMVGKAAFGVRNLDHAGNPITTYRTNAAGEATRRRLRGPSRIDRLTGVTTLTRALDRSTGGRFRRGLRDATDKQGIYALMAVDDAGNAVTDIGQGASDFVESVRKFSEATDPAEQAAIFARTKARHKNMMPLFDEVRGWRFINPSPIEAWKHADEVADAPVDELALLAHEPGVQKALNTPERTTDAAGRAMRERWTTERAGLYRTQYGSEVERTKSGWELRQNGEAVGSYRTLKDAKQAHRGDDFEPEYFTPPPPPPLVPAGPAIDGSHVDVNGVGGFVTKGESIWEAAARKGITPLEEFAEYFADSVAMLRLGHGVAAQRELLLPGRVHIRQRVAGWNAARRQNGRAAARNDEIYDHTKPYSIVPHEAEEIYQKAMDDLERLRDSGSIDLAEFARRGDEIYNEMRSKWYTIKKQRARWEARARKVSSLLPTVQAIDLTHAGSIEQVSRFARLYMNKTEADRLAALYAAGDIGRRREVLNGIIEQTLHASGLSRSEAGLKQIEKFHADQVEVGTRAYGLSGADVIHTAAGPRHVALLPSQLNNHVLIPDFRSLQFLSTKLAVGGAFTRAGHMRALATSEAVDTVSTAIKLGWITTAAGGFRNALDEIANAVLRADGASLLTGRAAFSKAKANARASRAEVARAATLQARILHSIPRAFRGIPRTVNDVLLARGLGRLMSFTHQPVDDLAIKHAEELLDMQKAEMVDKTVTGSYYLNDAVDPNAEALAIHGKGLHAAERTHSGTNVKYEFQGYQQVEVDGGVGLDNFTHNLGMHFQDLTSPAHVALREILAGGDAARAVVLHMQSDAMRHFLRDAEVFHFTRLGNPVRGAEQQLEAIERYAENLVANVTMLVAGKGKLMKPADTAAGTKNIYEFDITRPNWWADEHVVTPGPINMDMAEMLLRGDIPDRAWLKANLADEEMPSHVVAKVFAPINPAHKPGQILQGYTAMLATGYEFLVTRQIRALSRNPMLTAAYDQARRNLHGYETHLIDNGFTAEIAEQIAKRQALVQAEQLVIRSIDDPTQSTQYAMIARNIHAFARAQEDWLRRWGRTIRDNPQLVQRAQLYLHGAESAGLVERDDQGNLIFTYPGSGQIINLLGRISSILPGVENPVKLPVVPDMTSRLIFLNPSLDNPVGFSAMPLVSIPFDYLASLTGADHSLLKSSMDRAINGELGAGREWYEKLLPGWANRIYQGVINDEDPASQYTSALTSALMNLEAAGRTPAADASASEIARYQNDLKAQVQNQMIMRAIFGFIAPAAPSLPENDVEIDNEARIAEAEARGDTALVEKLRERHGDMVLQPSYVWQKAGLSTLKDEVRKVFGSMPYEEALVWWAENHPGELVYQLGVSPKTEVGDSSAQAPATIGAAKWMQENPYLLGEYGGKGGVATYFMPQGEGAEGDFSMDAYRAQLETGIREYKTFDEYFENIITQRGEAVYYDTKDDMDEAIAEAVASGNVFRARQLEDEWSVVKQQILGSNPLLAEKFAEYATSGITRERTITDLNRLLADPEAVTAIGPQAGGVAEMLYAQRVYESERQSVYGERGYLATSKREAAKADFESAIASVVRRFPGLGDLARGAFRTPN